MKKEIFEKNAILKLTFDFSLMVRNYCELLENKRRFILANQLFRSGTSTGANCMEAQNAESTNDFIHKMKIAAKGSEETQYWLMLCSQAKDFPDRQLLMGKLEEISKAFGKILATAKRKNTDSN